MENLENMENMTTRTVLWGVLWGEVFWTTAEKEETEEIGKAEEKGKAAGKAGEAERAHPHEGVRGTGAYRPR